MKTVKGEVTILADNVVQGNVNALGEHGFSAYIETGSGNLLFDTGMGRSLKHNASLYHKNIHDLKKVVLSHSHRDHTGGLPDVLLCQRRKPLDVHAHPDIFLYRYRKRDQKETYSGIPFTRGYLEKMGARFDFNTGYKEIQAGIFLTGEVPRHTSFEGGDMADRFVLRNGKEEADLIKDDQSMVIHTEKGLLIVLGCAHAGIINVIEHVIQQSGLEKIYAVVGGTHIGFSGEVQLRESITALKQYQIQHLIPSHCTGQAAAFRIKQAFEEIFHFSHVGLKLAF